MPYVPPSVAQDARNRAARTFVGGLLADVLLAASGALTLTLTDPAFDWTAAYWTGVGLTLAKTVLTTAISFIGRKVAPPQP